MTIGEASILCLKTSTTPKYLVLMTCLYVGFPFLNFLPKGMVAILIECPISSVEVSMIHKNANLNS